MAVEVMALVLESDVGGPKEGDAKGSPAKRLVLLCLANNANKAGYCKPGGAYLSGAAQVSERTVWRVIADLEEEGLLERAGRERWNRSTASNAYRVNLAELRRRRRTRSVAEDNELAALFDEPAADGTEPLGLDPRQADNRRSDRYDITSPHPGAGGTPARTSRHGGGDITSPRGGVITSPAGADTTSPLEPSLEPSPEPSLEPKDPPTPQRGADRSATMTTPPACAEHGPTCRRRACGTNGRALEADAGRAQLVAEHEARVRAQLDARAEREAARAAAASAGGAVRAALRAGARSSRTVGAGHEDGRDAAAG